MGSSRTTRSLFAWLALAIFLLASGATWAHTVECVDEAGNCAVCHVAQHSPAEASAPTVASPAADPIPWQPVASRPVAFAGHVTSPFARGPPRAI